MTTKKTGTAAQGASTPKKENQVKPISKKVDDAKKLQAYYDELAQNVKARTTLLQHKERISNCLSSPDLINQLSDDAEEQEDNVQIVIQTGDRFSMKYAIKNPALCKSLLLHLDKQLSTKLEEVEINLQNAHV